MGLFLSSFLVLFLETALIRWLPAYIRLLAYFSNFILLASFLGIGVGCLLATRRRDLFVWFPLVQLAVIVAVDRLRLEVALPSATTIYFSSGTAEAVVPVESTFLLPLLFTSVAVLFVQANPFPIWTSVLLVGSSVSSSECAAGACAGALPCP